MQQLNRGTLIMARSRIPMSMPTTHEELIGAVGSLSAQIAALDERFDRLEKHVYPTIDNLRGDYSKIENAVANIATLVAKMAPTVDNNEAFIKALKIRGGFLLAPLGAIVTWLAVSFAQELHDFVLMIFGKP